ncbi:thiamine pyrophosphate-dependent dehydrogenase E1 component subunit alpha [Paractinoplanes globisporus]|uniref:Thiamine pyrophosphate-dependent dehydrogenase E1 component subunit alpha n=1 Tax=Paractinoplanes globisporus TaxID=113565 RepID=A0ABW6WCI1_9ACTN|nr:thiamine pyrophosphate-dependent dehydrogenase E1 component subunit alpha [Actinoplanes globisporus]
MRYPLSEHDYGAHPAVLPPDDPTRHDGDAVPLPVRLDLYRKMQEMRLFEKRAYDLFMRQLVKGTSHLSLGMEAIAAGFGAALRADDLTFATYRGHAHTLARGVPMTPVLAELLGRSNGLMGGKGGSMHLTSVEHGVLGSYAIIGAHLTIANGAAWSAQYRGSGQVTVCFFGDGTTNIGAFHEALNYAAVFQLPVVFVCENNLYMEYTPIADITAVPRPAADRSSAYGLDPVAIDGNDADEVYLTATTAVQRARAGGGPSLIEAVTYRHGGHSRADPGKYRPADEVEAWKRYDPITVYRGRLQRLGIDQASMDRIDKEVAAEVDRATEEAIAGDLPSPATALTELWADGGSSWHN